MNEEKKKLKITANKKIITFSMIALALLMLVSTSYAYFTAVITGNDTAKQAKVTTGTMALKLHGNTQVGMSDVLPGTSATITFSVENTGTLATTYALNLDQVTNNFADKSDLVYTITSTNNGGSKIETVIPSENGVLIPVISIEPNVTQEYTMTITFKETNDIQNDNQGKTFTGRIQIGEANRNLLAAKILSDNTLIKETPNFSIGEPPVSGTNTGSGLYATEDNEGTSYYLRGVAENNYVDIGTTYSENILKYVVGVNGTEHGAYVENEYDAAVTECERYYDSGYGYASATACINDIQETGTQIGEKMLWRIVRINGDGTIRLVSDKPVSEHQFSNSEGDKYIGYTYDNSAPNVQDGTNSEMKNYLENVWYPNNITANGLDSLIAISSFCNDTSMESEDRYSSALRYDENTPSLICQNTDYTYGGKYKLKVGLLSSDEIMYAGIPSEYGTWIGGDTNNYLHTFDYFYTMTPGAPNEMSFYAPDGYLMAIYKVTAAIGVRPVINLRADAIISSGNGAKENPYVVE